MTLSGPHPNSWWILHGLLKEFTWTLWEFSRTLCGLLMASIRSLTVPVGKCKLQVEFSKTMVKQAQNDIHKEGYITDCAINSIKHRYYVLVPPKSMEMCVFGLYLDQNWTKSHDSSCKMKLFDILNKMEWTK